MQIAQIILLSNITTLPTELTSFSFKLKIIKKNMVHISNYIKPICGWLHNETLSFSVCVSFLPFCGLAPLSLILSL